MNKYRAIMTFVLPSVLLLSAAGARAQEEYEWKAGKWTPIAAPAKGTPQGELAQIRKYVDERQGRTAVNAAEKFLKQYADSPEAEEVMTLAAAGEMIRDRYFQAYEWYEKQLTQYPNGQYAERAMEREYDIAEAFLNGKKRIVLAIFYVPAQDDGISILGKIAEHAPGSNLAEKSLMRIADYHYNKQDYAEAAKDYDRYMDVFSKSPRASYAMLQAAKSSYASFRGVEWDDTPLLDAQQRYRAFAARFPLQAEQANVARTLETIRVTMAHKMFGIAQFYERVHHVGPARFYYRLVIQTYPATPWQSAANAALMRLGDGANGPLPSTMPASWPASAPASAPAYETMGADKPAQAPAAHAATREEHP